MTRSTTELLQPYHPFATPCCHPYQGRALPPGWRVCVGGGGIDAKREGCKPLFVAHWTGPPGCAMGQPMRSTKDSDPPAPSPRSAREIAREARLKLALKANMGRRKAQARARTDEAAGPGHDNDKAGLPDKPQGNG